MELKTVEKTKNTLEIEVIGETHSLCNAIRECLLKDDKVIAASYIVEHPILAQPKIFVKTNGSKTPRDALKEAAAKFKEDLNEFKKLFGQATSEKRKILAHQE